MLLVVYVVGTFLIGCVIVGGIIWGRS